MSFTPPSALQVGQVHHREFPYSLRSVFTVGPVLTIYSLLDPAGFFHPAALLGSRGRWRRIQRYLRSRGSFPISQNIILVFCPSHSHLAVRTRGSGLRPVPASLCPKTGFSEDFFPPAPEKTPRGLSQHRIQGMKSSPRNFSRNQSRTWKGQNNL